MTFAPQKIARLALLFSLLPTYSRSEPSSDEKKCDQAALDYCLKQMRVVELKHDMRLFHWFTGDHFQAKSATDYLNHALQSFGTSDPNASLGTARTAGLYLSTDPLVSCLYGKGDNPYLAVLNIPRGSRVGYFKHWMSPDFPKHCRNNVDYEGKTMGDCVKRKNLSLVAYSYQERKDDEHERLLFDKSSVAFTAGATLQKNPQFVMRTYDWAQLSTKKTKEAAVIRREITKNLTFWKTQCQGKQSAIFPEDPYTPAQLDSWAKSYLLNKSGSHEFFKLVEEAELPRPAAAVVPNLEKDKHE